ncbi:MAG: RsmE family RNA methyltransferase [Phycisphaeraceae bacterium]
MRRLFSDNLSTDPLPLDADQARHARKALRLKPGDAVELFDGQGNLAEGTLRLEGRDASVAVTRRWHEPRPKPAVTVAVAMPKGGRADMLIEKASELGADRIIPLRTQRSIVEVGDAKHDRLQRMAIASAKQSGRPHLMEVEEPRELDDLLAEAAREAFDPNQLLKLIADPEGVGTVGAMQLLGALGSTKRVLVLVGPEGGWAEQERQQACDAGFVPWRMGPYVLRVETAVMAAVALCRQIL